MALVLNGSGSITGLSAGGLPDGSVTADDIASTLDLSGKTITNMNPSGIYLGGTGAANYLDDYETGTWTASAASGSGVNVTTNYARYLKVGNLVQIEFKLWIGSTADSNSAIIGGLPFTANSTSGNAAGSGLSWATAAGAYSALVLTSTTQFGIRRMDTASDPAWSAIDNGYIRGSFTYQI